ncbi:hypothetical protein PMIN02_000443 [Paraphaeosphaeria minitans]
MSTSEPNVTQHRHVTPPSRSTNQPLTPPLTDKKPFTEAPRIIALFRRAQAGIYAEQEPWNEFILATGEYDQIERTLLQDAKLSGYVRSTRSTEIRFAASAPSSKSKYEPDASFRHEEAKHPGVVIEVAYSQKKERLRRLAENYLLDSDANIRAVVCLDIEYSKESRKATVSIWRPEVFHTADGPELQAVEKPVDQAFRDDEGNPVDQPGLRLRLSDFTYEGLAQKELGDEDTEIYISGTQFCQHLDAADSQVKQALGEQALAKEVRKRKRSETPPEEIGSSDEARYAEQEKRAAKRADHDMNYNDDDSSIKSLSE